MRKLNHVALKALISRIPRTSLTGLINRGTLWKHKHGMRKPDLESARVYSSLLGMTLEEFYSEIERIQ